MVGLFLFLNKEEYYNFLSNGRKVNTNSNITLITYNNKFDKDSLPDSILESPSKVILIIARDGMSDLEAEFKKNLSGLPDFSQRYIVLHVRTGSKGEAITKKKKDHLLQIQWTTEATRSLVDHTPKFTEKPSGWTKIYDLKKAINYDVSNQHEYEQSIFKFINVVFNEILNELLELLHLLHIPSIDNKLDEIDFTGLKDKIISNNFLLSSFSENILEQESEKELMKLEQELDGIWNEFYKVYCKPEVDQVTYFAALSEFRNQIFGLLEKKNLI